MPIEIRELIIKTKISTSQRANPTDQSDFDRRSFVDECVQLVMKKLKKKSER